MTGKCMEDRKTEKWADGLKDKIRRFKREQRPKKKPETPIDPTLKKIELERRHKRNRRND